MAATMILSIMASVLHELEGGLIARDEPFMMLILLHDVEECESNQQDGHCEGQ